MTDLRGRTALAGIILVVLSAMGFGSTPALARMAYDGGADTVTVVLLRFAVGLAVVLPVAVWRAEGITLDASHIRYGLLLGAGFVVQSLSYAASVQYIAVGLAALIFFMFPLVVALLSRVLDGKPVGRKRAVCLFAALVGVALTAGLAPSGADPRGMALAAIAAVSGGCTIFLGSRLSNAVGSLDFTLLTFAGGLLVMVLLALPMGVTAPQGGRGWAGLMLAGVAFAVGCLTFFKAVTLIDDVHASIVSNVEPLWAALMAWILVGELLSPPQFLGVLLVVGAVVLSSATAPAPRPALPVPEGSRR